MPGFTVPVFVLVFVFFVFLLPLVLVFFFVLVRVYHHTGQRRYQKGRERRERRKWRLRQAGVAGNRQ